MNAQPRTCPVCESEFIATPKHASQIYCGKTCADKARMKADSDLGFRRYRTEPNHPLARGPTVSVQRAVLYDRVGSGPHPCHWCGKFLDWKHGLVDGAITADHVDANWRNNDPSNIVVACVTCNSGRTNACPVADDEVFIVRTKPSGRTARIRAEARTCRECGQEFLVPKAIAARGKGLYCGYRCAGAVKARAIWAKRRADNSEHSGTNLTHPHKPPD